MLDGQSLIYGPVPIGDPPVMQPEVVALVEPVPMLDRVPTPVQAVPCDRVTDWLIVPDTLGTDGSLEPKTGTCVPTPDAGDEGTWRPPPGTVVGLVATALFGFAKVDGACAKAPALPAATKAATASEVKSLLFMVRISRETNNAGPVRAFRLWRDGDLSLRPPGSGVPAPPAGAVPLPSGPAGTWHGPPQGKDGEG